MYHKERKMKPLCSLLNVCVFNFHRPPTPLFLQKQSLPQKRLLKLTSLVGNDTPGAPVGTATNRYERTHISRIQCCVLSCPVLFFFYEPLSLSNCSLSVMVPTRLKPRAWLHTALCRRKTSQCGCVVASTPIRHLSVMAHTSWNSSRLPF